MNQVGNPASAITEMDENNQSFFVYLKKPKRNRGPNFSAKERLTLTKIMKQYDKMVNDPNWSREEKNKIWMNVSQLFAKRMNSEIIRDPEMLKQCWENLKRKARIQNRDVFSDAFALRLASKFFNFSIFSRNLFRKTSN